MKRGLIFLFLFILFSLNLPAQSDTVVFNGTIPEITLNEGINKNVVDLSVYFNSSNQLTYKFKPGEFGLEGVDVSINSNGKVDMIPRSKKAKSIIFLADDDLTVAESNDIKIIVAAEFPAITFSPNTDSLQLIQNEARNFAVSGADNVQWFLDDVLLNQTGSVYSFSKNEVKLYNLKAVADNFTKNWIISVLAEKIVNPPNATTEPEKIEPVCGNGIKEGNENCSNCAADVSCSINSECINSICVVKKDDFNFGLISWLVLFAVLVIAIVTGIIFIGKRKRRNLKIESNETITDEKNIFNKIIGVFKKDKKEISSDQTGKELYEDKTKSLEEIELNPLISYFKTNLNKYKKEDLIMQSLKQGWKQEQVDKALAKLENTGDGNDNTNENKRVA
ncbi:hypothetical protein HYT56_01500 [Candidatus Woesearchaeota archaeon]|nr:hypothetical protein [Candidatus Woesearchaeota archaeon]